MAAVQFGVAAGRDGLALRRTVVPDHRTQRYGGAIDASYFDMRPNFMPLFPMMIRALAMTGVPLVAAGLLLANAASVIGLACLHQVLAGHTGERIATRAVWVVAFFPSSLFLSSVYSEGPLMAFTMGAWLAATNRRPAAAGILALGASLTRPLGVIVLVPLAVIAWRRCATTGERWRQAVAAMLVPSLLGLLAYLWWAGQTWGDALALTRTQAVYRGATTWPWMAFARWWHEGPAVHGYANSSIDAALALGALAATWRLARRHAAEFALFAAMAVLVPLSSSLISFSRMLLAAPMLALPIAAFGLAGCADATSPASPMPDRDGVVPRRPDATASRRPSLLLLAWMTGSLLGLAWCSARFATWRWVA